ncbi:MAG: PAS domain S-box protein, partial [Syntrophales bacterium]|nr:PAS domain S-box protein [Syntrophales bacterium]
TVEYTSQMGIFIAQDGKFKYVNRHSENQWGYNLEEMIGKDPMSLVHRQDRTKVKKAAVEMLKGHRSTPIIYRTLTKKGGIRWVTETVASIPYKGKRAVLGNYMDITEQIESRKRLEELEALEASILEAMPHAVIGLHDRRIVFANDGVEAVFGGNAKDIVGKNPRLLYRSDKDYDDIDKFLYNTMEKQRTAGLEFPCRRKDGQDIECSISAARIGKYLKEKNIVVTFEDITERREAKNDLEQSREQLRKLTVHLQSVREQERTVIARELHDELGQLLTALNTNVILLQKKIPPELTVLSERTEAMSGLIDMTMQTLKRIYMSLRPGMLDHLGLTASVSWLTDEFEQREGIACKLKIDPEDMIIGPEISTALYRIFQETLTNISRHAEASRVLIRLKATAKKVQLTVTDNGKGFTQEQQNKPHSFGLLGIRERAAHLGGTVETKGEKGKGTTINVTIPLNQTGASYEKN